MQVGLDCLQRLAIERENLQFFTFFEDWQNLVLRIQLACEDGRAWRLFQVLTNNIESILLDL